MQIFDEFASLAGKGTTYPLFLNNLSFSSGKCIILRANTPFCDPVQKDYYNAVSVFDNMDLFALF